MHILHFTACKQLSQGQKKQLCYEQAVARNLQPHHWTITALSIKAPEKAFEKQYPILFRTHFMRKLYAWIFLLTNYKKYDIILMRHMTYDPFLILFGWFIPNRVTVHHSKEVEELLLAKPHLTGKLASLLERLSGWANVRQVRGLLGVTREIARYELETYQAKCPWGIYPNGIDLEQVAILPDERHAKAIHIAFVCGKFAAWHGLDRLLHALYTHSISADPLHIITVHLIGEIHETQRKGMSLQLPLKNTEVLCHGRMHVHEYTKILSLCDIGIDSLALERKGLAEASALKVREYLAQGLAVYSGCSDTALPDDFPYYVTGPVQIDRVVEFALQMKTVSRSKIRQHSIAYIQKSTIMRAACEWFDIKPGSVHYPDYIK